MADVYSSFSFPTIEEDANLTTSNVANHSYGDKILLSTINIVKNYYNVTNISFEVYVNGNIETVEQNDNGVYVFCGGRMGISFAGSYTALNVGQNLSVTFSGISQTETSGMSERDYMQFDIYVTVYQYINTGGEKGNTSGDIIYDNVEIKSFADNIEDNTSQIRVRNYTANEIADTFGIPITQTYTVTYYNSDCGYDELGQSIDNEHNDALYTVSTNSSVTLLNEEAVRVIMENSYADYGQPFEDYTFKGWATSDGGLVAYAGGATFTPTADTNLYAVWEEVVDSITLTGQDGADYTNKKGYGLDNGYWWWFEVTTVSGTWNVTSSNPDILYIVTDGTRCSIKFKNIGYTRLTFTSGTASCYIDWYNRVTVTFDTDGGEAISDIVSYDTFTAPTATKASEALSSTVFSFFMNDGTSSIVQSTTVTKYKKYDFVEWEGDDDNYYSAGQVSALTQNLNLTATYEESTYYDPTTITVPANPTREGYRFLGWSDTANGTVNSSITAGKTITIEQPENMRNYYYAQWEEVVLEQAEIVNFFHSYLIKNNTYINNIHINFNPLLEFSLVDSNGDIVQGNVNYNLSWSDNGVHVVNTIRGNNFVQINLAYQEAYQCSVTVTAEAEGYEIEPYTLNIIIDDSLPNKWTLIRDNNFDIASLQPNEYWHIKDDIPIIGGDIPQFKNISVCFMDLSPSDVPNATKDIYLFYVPESYNIPLGERGWGEASYADDPLILAQEPENNRFYLLSLPSSVTGGDTTADITVKIESENFDGEVKMNLERD